MARLRARGPPGESCAPAGMELRMERIQELISAFKETAPYCHASSFKSLHRNVLLCEDGDLNSVVNTSPHPWLGTGTLSHLLA